ncbi:MAG: hypothetical protein ABI591_00190 [Kofleriaceae bacterium]
MKLRFCSPLCWEKHVPTARHRKANYVVEGGSATPPTVPSEKD